VQLDGEWGQACEQLGDLLVGEVGLPAVVHVRVDGVEEEADD
jgi:hypothetical protein